MGQSRGSCGFFNVTFAVMGFGNFGMSMGDFCLTVEGPAPKKNGGVRFDNGRPSL